MARLITAGFEGAHPHVDGGRASLGTSGTLTIGTSIKRSGTYAGRIASGATSSTNYLIWDLPEQTDGVTYHYRIWLYLENLPDATTHLVQIRDNTGGYLVLGVTLDPSGVVRLIDLNSNNPSANTATLSVATWQLIQISHTYSSSGLGTVSWSLNGVAIDTGLAIDDGARTPDLLRLGYATVNPGANKAVWFDDVAVNDSTGAAENGPPDPAGKIVVLLPVSVTDRGVWTGGAGGTVLAEMLTALTTRPPVGTASETNTTQIESAGTGVADAITLVTGSYTAAGVGGSDPITLVQAVIADGEDVTAGTKTGSLRLSANPADAGAVSYNPGDDVGALGTYPTGWARHGSAPVSAPSVTRGSGATIVITDTDISNRVQAVCFAAVMVEYVPYVVPAATLTRPMIVGVG